MRFLLLLLVLCGCEPVEEALDGVLVQVEVSTEATDCSPARFVGDAGLQFFGERPDGGVAFTMAVQAKYGPTVDGGVLQSAAPQLIPTPNQGKAFVGEGSGCEGAFSNWERTDGGLRLTQAWPGGDTCPMGPIWLPRKACSTTRLFTFTQVGTCQLGCVRIDRERGEITCRC